MSLVFNEPNGVTSKVTFLPDTTPVLTLGTGDSSIADTNVCAISGDGSLALFKIPAADVAAWQAKGLQVDSNGYMVVEHL